MPRVVRDVIQITRTIRPPVREPPRELPLADPESLPPDNQPSIPVVDGWETVQWQVVIVIHVLPDLPIA